MPIPSLMSHDIRAQVMAILVVLAALFLKMLIDSLVSQQQSPFLIFPAAIMLSAWYGGWKAGFVSTVLSLLLINWFYLPPANSFWVVGVESYVKLGVFLGEGTLICLLAEQLHQSRSLAEHRASETSVARQTANDREADYQLAQAQLTARDALFRRLVDANVVGIIVCHQDGRVFDANAAFLDMVELTRDDLLAGRVNWRTLTPAEYADQDQGLLEELARSSRFEPVEKEYVTASGRRVPVWLGGASIPQDDKVVCFVMDLTLKKQAATALVQAKEAAERANRARGEFMANVSHELRTPMNAILGMTELALDEELPPAIRDYLETSVDAARTLLYLLNDLLDFSRIESGRIEMEVAPFSLRNTLDQAMRILAMRASEQGLELACSVDSRLPDTFVGDQGRLRQIVLNLVGNAIKFTEHGEVIVELVPVPDAARSQTADTQLFPDDTTVTIAMIVKDTGIGISAAQQTRVFEPFTQADASATRVYGGTGLGLSIVRQLVTRMGGEISLESTLGSGSTFRVELPFQLGSPEQQSAGDRSHRTHDLVGVTVLAIDDNRSNRRILENILRSWGMEPTVVADALAALQQMREAQRQGREYRVILVDALMPAMDGLQFIQTATTEGLLRGAAILMVSASDRQSLEPQLRALPISAVLAKPISQSDLLDTLMDALQGRQQTVPATGQIRASRRRLRILVAEDAPANRKVVRAILEKRGHDVMLVSNGREAVEAVQRETFDIVLMDIQMPVLDGWHATREIRGSTEHSQVPILAMTAHAMRGDREKCLAAGMSDYISKPIDAHELIRVVERLARKSQGREALLPDMVFRGRPLTTETPDRETADMHETPRKLLDRDGSLQRMGGDEKLLKDMAKYFLQDAPELLQILQQQRVGDAAERAAHSLRGLSANFGAKPVMEVAAKLEAPCDNPSEREELINELHRLVHQLFDELNELIQG